MKEDLLAKHDFNGVCNMCDDIIYCNSIKACLKSGMAVNKTFIKERGENHESWEVMENNHQQIDQLLQKYIGSMYGSLGAASIQYFLETGKINGMFRLNLVRMMLDPLLNSPTAVQGSDTTKADSSNGDGSIKNDWKEELSNRFEHCFLGQNTSFKELTDFVTNIINKPLK